MRLKFYSTERNISRIVTEFFEKFGDLGVLSIKAHNGHHDLLFKVPREYSIRSVSTDLVVKVNGVDVLVEYPEDDINFDFYEKDLQLIQEIQSSLETPKIITEQSTFFHHISSSRASNRCSSIQAIQFLNREYLINQDDEEDCLSDLDFETELEDNDKVELEDTLKTYSFSNGSDYFSTSNNSNYFSRIHQLINPIEGFKSREQKPKTKPKSTSKTDSSGQTYPSGTSTSSHFKDLNSPSINTAGGKLSDGTKEGLLAQTSKKSSRRRRKKGTAKGEANVREDQESNENTCTEDCASKKPINTYEIVESNDDASHTSNNGDGNQLLALIWPECSDFSELDAKIMPEVHMKWRRFVEIKDSMRKERYLEYLKHRSTDTAVDIVDSSLQLSEHL